MGRIRHLRGDNHELLEGETATSVGTAVKDVLEGNGKNVGLLGASEVRDVGVERNALSSSTGLSNSQGNTEDGVGTEVGLVGGTIELDEESINGGLVLDVDVLLDQGGGDLLVDVGNGLEDTLAEPAGLVTVTELASLVLAGGSTRGNNGAVKTGLSDDIDLDGGVTARVVDLASVNLRDTHFAR